VIEWHWHTDAVGGTQSEPLPDQAAIVEDVVMREGGRLGMARRARRELYVDGVVCVQPQVPQLSLRRPRCVQVRAYVCMHVCMYVCMCMCVSVRVSTPVSHQ
jgi:hypothetical protein